MLITKNSGKVRKIKTTRFNKLALHGETYIHMKKLFVKGGLFHSI